MVNVLRQRLNTSNGQVLKDRPPPTLRAGRPERTHGGGEQKARTLTRANTNSDEKRGRSKTNTGTRETRGHR